MSNLKKRMTEICSKKSGPSCCMGEIQMLPALIDNTKNEVICGPEAIVAYIIIEAAKKPEMIRGSCI